MKCFVCRRRCHRDAMRFVSQNAYDAIVDSYGLIALHGPDDCFNELGEAVICDDCVDKVPIANNDR